MKIETRVKHARVMGVDPSTKTGVCVLDQGDSIKDPPLVAFTEVVKSAAAGFARPRNIAYEVGQMLWRFLPDLVVIEGYAMGNRHSLVTLVEIGTLIRDRVEEDCQWVAVAPTQLKKFVLGTGAGKKDQMRLGVYKRWGFEHKSDDVIDAYGLACMGLALRGKLKTTKVQKDVLAKITGS